MAHRGGLPASPMCVPVKLQVNQERSRRPAVGHQIAHQRVDNIGIDFHRCSNHSYSNAFGQSARSH
jgi:hypothetical protein